jgi:hypothetical protein
MKVMIKCFVHAEKEPWDKEMKYSVYPFSMVGTSRGYALIDTRDVELEVPDDFDIRPSLVATLEREKKELMAKFQARVTEIDGEIQSLLAIENKPTVQAAEDIPF